MTNNKKAIFLDRDGVLNELVFYKDQGVVDSPNSLKQFNFIPGVIGSLKLLQKLNYKLIVISNQPGIAKGKYDETEFIKIKNYLEKKLLKHNIKMDAQYYCLHHPNAIIKKYKKKCRCRKPNTKMIIDAAKKFKIDLNKSYVIGDGLVDMELAKKIKCKSIFIGNINLTITKKFNEKKLVPDYIAHDISEAAIFIKKTSN